MEQKDERPNNVSRKYIFPNCLKDWCFWRNCAGEVQVIDPTEKLKYIWNEDALTKHIENHGKFSTIFEMKEFNNTQE